MNEKQYCKNGISLDIFWQNIPLFVELARQKNFSRTADILSLNVSTLSRRIKALEASLGISLFVRNTRSVVLTPEGEDLYAKCIPMLRNAEEIYEKGTQKTNNIAGIVRLSIFSEMYYSVLANELPKLLNKWPGLQLSMFLTDKPTDLHSEPVDLDLRLGDLPTSSLNARKLTSLDLYIFAAPSLFERYPMPECPEDLTALPGLTLIYKGSPWVLSRGKETCKVMVNSRHTSTCVRVLKDLTVAGMGIMLLRPAEAQEFVEQGKLMQVLPEWKGLTLDVHLLWANSKLPSRVRVVKDFLCEVFAKIK